MGVSTLDLRTLAPSARMDVQAEAVRALGEGKVVVAASETGYLACASAGLPVGAELARSARSGRTGVASAVWLAPDVAGITGAVGHLNAIAMKIIRGLAPGPAVFAIGLDEAALAGAAQRLGVAPGVIDDAGALHVRVCGPSLGATLGVRSGTPLCCWEPADESGRSFLDAQQAAGALEALGVNPAMVISAGAPTGGGARRRPSVIALERAGGVRVLVEGAYETRYVMKQAALNILFVCTGNTCRSPMAEAIASGLGARRAKGAVAQPVLHVSSAGIGAAAGAPRAAEGNAAVRARGFEPSRGASRPLTRQMIAEADFIYTMTRSHLNGVLGVDPAAKAKAFTIDPAGADVADPIGLSQDAYNDVAERLEGLVRERLKEWMP